MAKLIEIVPQKLTVSAPAPLVFQLLSQVTYQCLPDSGRTVSLVSSDASRTVAVFSTLNVQGETKTVKEIVAAAPDRVIYTHLTGPYTGAREEIRVEESGPATRITLTASFPLIGGRSARLLKLSFEHAAQQHLRDIKGAVEAQTQHVQHRDLAASVLVPVPTMTTERQLLEAVDVQEEIEWGHVGHGRGVTRVAVGLAESVAMPQRQIDSLARAALLHDVGKVALTSSLWGTLGVLAPEKRELMYAHPRLGSGLAARAGLPDSIQTAIHHHHERWDGAGYPDHLAGEAIPLRARILSLAESIDTMMRRSYRRETLTTEQIIERVQEDEGRRWDPMLAREVCRMMRGK